MGAYSLHPVLTDDILGRIRFQGNDYKFSYTNNGTEQPLDAKAIDANTYSLSDPNYMWSPDTDDWSVGRHIQIMSPSFLFGPKGIAPSLAVLGVGVVWISTESKQRGISRVGQFNKTANSVSFDMKCKFSQMQLRGRVELSTVLFLAVADENLPKDECHLANMPGTILGEIEKLIVNLDGKGSFFPIRDVNAPYEPLWYLTCEWENAATSSFSESVCLKLNKEHKHYRYLDHTSQDYDDRLIREIMASALAIIITKLKDNNEWNLIEGDENLDHGSVAEAVRYFTKTLGWITSSPESLSVSIRKYFDKEMK